MTLRPPPSLHEPRIVAYPVGRLFRVVSQGYGLMPSYADVLSIEDRWAVVAYVQALELSQRVELARLPVELRNEAEPWLR
jgi:Cytochrome C oxidase, cbb3-type, subunit III